MTLATATNWYDTTGTTGELLCNTYTSCETVDIYKLSQEISSNISSNISKILKEDKESIIKKDTKGTINKNMENTNKVDKEKKYDPYEIVDYKVINDTVVIVTFADETTEKAVCNKNDTYDFERAIEICICKKKFGGTKEYNTAIKNALRQVKAVDEKKKKEAEEKELAERREAKIAKRKAKRKAQRRQQRIDDMSEAFLNAMLEYDDKIFEMDMNKDQTSDDVNIPENVSD